MSAWFYIAGALASTILVLATLVRVWRIWGLPARLLWIPVCFVGAGRLSTNLDGSAASIHLEGLSLFHALLTEAPDGQQALVFSLPIGAAVALAASLAPRRRKAPNETT